MTYEPPDPMPPQPETPGVEMPPHEDPVHPVESPDYEPQGEPGWTPPEEPIPPGEPDSPPPDSAERA